MRAPKSWSMMCFTQIKHSEVFRKELNEMPRNENALNVRIKHSPRQKNVLVLSTLIIINIYLVTDV